VKVVMAPHFLHDLKSHAATGTCREMVHAYETFLGQSNNSSIRMRILNEKLIDIVVGSDVDMGVKLEQLVGRFGANLDNGHLAEAVRRREPDVVRALLYAGANPNYPAQIPSIMRCLALHQPQNVEELVILLDNGLNVNAIDMRNSQTMLHYAAREGHVPMVRLLLNRGVRTNTKTIQGSTALHFAVLNMCPSSTEVIELLLPPGTGFDMDSNGRTAMDILSRQYSPPGSTERATQMLNMQLFEDHMIHRRIAIASAHHARQSIHSGCHLLKLDQELLRMIAYMAEHSSP
jgi:hypothetical protein